MNIKKSTDTEQQPTRTGPLIDEEGNFVSQRKEASSMSNARSHFGAPLDVLRSQAQKELRRGNIKQAMLALDEIARFGFRAYAAKIPLICAVEDCADPMVSVKVHAIYANAKDVTSNFHQSKASWLSLFLAKMVIEVARAQKSWESHHLAMYAELHDKQVMKGEIQPQAISAYALDCHTALGRRCGATISGFWKEFEALSPSPVVEDDEFYELVHGEDEAL